MNTINDRQQFTKDSIAILADQARENINQNKYLLKKINIFKQQIIVVKNLITNFWINSNQKNNKNIIAKKYIEELTLLNSRLKEEIHKDLSKQNLLYKKSINELSIENRTLSQLSIDNFILNNTLVKLNSSTQSLNNSIEISKKYEIFREAKRETMIDLKQSKNVFPVYNLELQQKMLSYCRAYSKYRYKNAKKLIKINLYKKDVFALIDLIKVYTSKLTEESEDNKLKSKTIKSNSNIKKLDLNKILDKKGKSKTKKLKRTKTSRKFSKKIYDQKIEDSNLPKSNENRQNSFENHHKSLNLTINRLFNSEVKMKKEEQTERKKINLLKIDELLDIDNIEAEDENIIDNELNSDDDVFFEKKVKPKKKICKEYLSNLRKEIPIINLSQIEFNKIKVINEADAYSLQKRNLEQNNINWQIKNLRKQIKNLEKQIDINENKLKVIHNFIEDVKYNYKLLRPIKVQSSAAGNPVAYIREKLLDVVGETIDKAEKKDKLGTEKKTEKTAEEEGAQDYEDEIVGSDYSDEDEYIDNYKDKFDAKEINQDKDVIKNNYSINKENINDINIINNNNKVINLSHKLKTKTNKIKNKNKDIKKNLLFKFNHEECRENSVGHDYLDNFKNNGALSK